MLITAETASEMGKRSVEARKARKIEAQTPLPIVSTESPTTDSNGEYARVYQDELTRLRGQLSNEDDPQRIDKLCSAIFRLEQVYCRYAGIPGPGNRKPAADKPARQRPAMVEPS